MSDQPRDPRRDPAAGDRLRKPGMERVVNYLDSGMVEFTECRRGGMVRIAIVNVSSWRRWASDAEVVRAE